MIKPRTKGDTAFPPTFTCLADGVPVDLTGADVSLRLIQDDLTKEPTIAISNQSTHRGQLVPTFDDDDVDTVGNWEALVLAVFSDGKRATFRGAYVPIIDG